MNKKKDCILEINTNITCRTCLTQDSKLNNIFAKVIISDEIYSFPKILEICCDIQVLKTDDLPTKICTPCKDQIKKHYAFKLMCDRSKELLNNIYYQQDNLKRNGVKIIKIISDTDPMDNQIDSTENLYDCDDEENSKSIQENMKNHGDDNDVDDKDNEILIKTEENLDVFDLDNNQLYSNDSCDDSNETNDNNKLDDDDLMNNPPKKKSKNICEYCNRIFTKSADLKRHLDTHFRVRYKCRICTKTYTQLSPRNRHMKLFHPDEMAKLLDDNENPFSALDPKNLPIRNKNVIC